ncbi:MAG: hypothetical protein Kow00128_12320 [Deltaproteobacteria bacterium]
MFSRQGKNLFRSERKRKPFTLGLLAALAFLLLGAAIPHRQAARLPGPEAATADAILVPAGGGSRIAEGFRAWREGRGRHLFILGAGREASPERILPGGANLTPEERSRVHIESWSENTLENAVSARMSVDRYGLHSVLLVTSGYHLARAHLALRTMLPESVSIRVLAVHPEGELRGSWWRYPFLYLTEGWKYWGYRILLRWK